MASEAKSSSDHALRVLQLQEARWQAILDTARDAIVSIDETGQITLFNRAAEEIFGYTAEEAIGQNVRMLMPSPYREEHDDYLESYRRTGVARAIGRIREVQGQRKGGEVFPIELSVSQARIGDGVIYSAVVRDVTERHAMLAGLERRAREQAAIAELGLRALELDVPSLTQRAAEIVARTLEVDLCKILEILPGGAAALLRAGVGWRDGMVGNTTVPLGERESQAGYTIHSGDAVVFDDAQETRFARAALLEEHGVVSGASVPIHGSRGGLFGVLGAHSTRSRRFTANDVGFLHSVASVVAEAVERSRAEVRLATQYAVTRSLAGAISLRDVVPELLESVCEGLGWHLAELWRVDRGANRLRREGTWHDADIDAAAFESASSQVTFAPGEGLAGRAWTARRAQWVIDVSADPEFMRRQLARDLGLRTAVAAPIAAGDQVEGVLTVFGRAVNPPDERLLEALQSVGMQIGEFIARQCAEEASERQERLAEIGTLTAKIVHDIGNPLAGLSMLASRIARRLARDPNEPISALRVPIEQVGETVRRLDGLIQDFKNFAREQRLDIEEVPLESFLADVVRAWEPEASERGISLVLEPEATPWIHADPAKLRRVLDNLMKNAIEAIDRGPGWVRIGTSVPTDEKIRITVEDDGPGIPSDLRLFELFATTKAHGTGLGLAISKQILLAHGGGIQFAPGAKRGAAFHIDLPRRRTTL